MDRKTYCEAYFNFIDVTALADSSAASTVAKDFSITELFHKDIRQPPYGTMELNQFVLDGSREIFPSEPPEDVPLWSEEKSDASCIYVKNPTLEVSFSESHSSIGLNLYFAEDIPAEILITWYTLFGTKLISETFYPDKKAFFCKKHVQNYGKIVIEFVKSSYPFRYAKMDHMEFGQMWQLGRDNIKTASVLEELDCTSATLSINTATMEIVDAANEFDVSNENGLWKSLQKEQAVTLVEYVNGISVDCGTFYLDKWSSQKNIAKFSMIDAIGLMDKTMFYEGQIYTRVKAGIIIDAIMASCGIKKYQVEDTVAETLLNGWLAIQSHRAALQQVVFACGAVADCSRSDMIKIYRLDRYSSHTIGLDRKFTGTKVTMDEYVSGVTVSFNQYRQTGESKQISKSILTAGETMIEFKDPFLPSSVTVSAGTIRKVRTNYVVVFMENEGECIISGNKYEAVENACTANVPIIAAGENENVKTFKGCTLMDAVQAKKSAEYILSYYQLRQIVEMRYINDGEAVGNWCELQMKDGGTTMTGIGSQTLDLTGGNLAAAKCRGYNSTSTSYYFCGELYAGEEGLI